MRILCYVAGLTGLGHYRRMTVIAESLASAHEVVVLNGGRSDGQCFAPTQVDLPVLPTDGTRLMVPTRAAAVELWAARERVIGRATEEPFDAVLIEHFPFSKWELGSEIESIIVNARAVNPDVRVLASVRDIVGRTSRERVEAVVYETQVLELLSRWFHAVVVHADPSLVQLDGSFAAAGRITIPVHHTGYVVDDRAVGRAGGRHGPVVVACGGGAGQGSFVDEAARLARESELGAACGVEVVLGPSGGRRGPTRKAYLDLVAHAPVCVTRAGYNTVCELAAMSTRAVLVPDARMSDQGLRASLLAGRTGFVRVDEADMPAVLPGVIDGLAHSEITSGRRLDLNGAAATRAVIEQLTVERRPGDQ